MKAILRSVSRSFYLSIRWLPQPLREPMGVAYLLARSSDTIADTAEIPTSFRLTSLSLISQVIAGELPVAGAANTLQEFAAQQSDPAERTLIENFDNCIASLRDTSAEDQHDIRQLLRTIIHGQQLDLERFGGQLQPAALQTAAELEEYTYLVAGCVGEFWTKLGLRHCRPFSRLQSNELSQLGVAYGKGLQLINVLRDRPADLQAGRDYLPAEQTAVKPVEEVFTHWLEKADQGLDAGIDYCASLTNWRIRFATALPALIGARTIALMRETGVTDSQKKIKVPRAEVYQLLRRGFLASASVARLRALYNSCRS